MEEMRSGFVCFGFDKGMRGGLIEGILGRVLVLGRVSGSGL